MGQLLKLNAKRGLTVRAKSDKRAEIIIYDEIGDSFWFESFSVKDFDEKLKELPNSVKDLDIRINSPGGDVFDGVAIYNRIRDFKRKKQGEITVFIDGWAASIASIIAMAGDRVVMGVGSTMMIHKPMSGRFGNANELQELIDLLDDIEENLISIYKKRVKDLSREEIKKMLADETWMSANDAIEKGFADEMGDEEAMPVAASAALKNQYRRMPEMNNKKVVQSKVEQFKNEIKGFLARK